MYSPSNEDPRAASPNIERGGGLASPTEQSKRPFFFRGSSVNRVIPQSTQQEEVLNDLEAYEEGISPSASEGGAFVLIESPNSKARARRAMTREKEAAITAATASAAATDLASTTTATSSARSSPVDPVASSASEHFRLFHASSKRRDKSLPRPPPPPVEPVLPTFDDLQPQSRRGSTPEMMSEGSNMKRKSSMIKKLREKMVSKLIK